MPWRGVRPKMSIKERSSIKNFTITAGASGVLLITSVSVYDVGGVVSLFFWMLPLAMLQYFLSSRKKRYIVFSILSLFICKFYFERIFFINSIEQTMKSLEILNN